MKNSLFLIVFITTSTFAQIDTTYFDANGKKAEKASADRCRIIERQGELYLVKDINVKTNLPQMVGYCSQLEPTLHREGKSIFYFGSGQKSTEGNYVNDKRSGIWTVWTKDEKDSLVVDCAEDGTYKNIFVPASQSMNKEMNVSYKTEMMPEFPGGEQALFQFIAKNVKYPQVSLESGIMGTCFVTFVVEADGRVTDIKILRGVKNGADCDAEALRVVNQMPNWKPGIQFGRAVRVQFNLPIKFKLT